MDSFDQMNSTLISANIDLQVQDDKATTKARSLKKNLLLTMLDIIHVILLSEVDNIVHNVTLLCAIVSLHTIYSRQSTALTSHCKSCCIL